VRCHQSRSGPGLRHHIRRTLSLTSQEGLCCALDREVNIDHNVRVTASGAQTGLARSLRTCSRMFGREWPDEYAICSSRPVLAHALTRSVLWATACVPIHAHVRVSTQQQHSRADCESVLAISSVTLYPSADALHSCLHGHSSLGRPRRPAQAVAKGPSALVPQQQPAQSTRLGQATESNDERGHALRAGSLAC
jgi:hypothetical protein